MRSRAVKFLLDRVARRLPHCFLVALLLCCSTGTGQEPVRRKVTAADMPRIPPTEVANVLDTFQQARGFQMEIVAAEPLVSDPVAACFDEFGRMFVAEMHGYPFSQEPTRLNPAGGGLKDGGIIRMLEDTDGDGRMDKSVVFADKLSWPTSVCCYDGGLFVIAPLHLYYLKDTDNDGKADVREIVLSGFARDNVQAVTNGLQWGLDNKITFAAGRNPKQLVHRGKPLFAVGANDLRFDPKTEVFERVTGGLQFGHSMDEWGTRFVCSNSNHIQQVVFPQHYLARNPYLSASGLIRSIARDGASARVYRISPPEPWRIIRQKWRAADKGYKLVINRDGGWEFLPLDPSKKKGAVPTEYPVGFFTSATGITIYRGDAYPDEFRGNAFVGDVGGNLVHRKSLQTEKVVYQAERADKDTEFVRSRDNWFRPVNFVNAPDGTLYVLDMYRETVEHPYSVPDEIKKFLHLTSGRDRGRIYRLVSPEMKRRELVQPGKLEAEALVALLGSDNGWHRMNAQRLLWERKRESDIPLVEKLLATSTKPLGRLHALCLLDGIGALQDAHLLQGLKDSHPRVRAHVVRLAEPRLKRSPELLEQVVKLAADANEHVRFQVAFSLGEAEGPRMLTGLAELARNRDNGAEVQTALLSSVGRAPEKLAIQLLNDTEFVKRAEARSMLSRLGQMAGANPQAEGARQLLAAATADSVSLLAQQGVLSGLGQGLQSRGATLSGLVDQKGESDPLRRQVAEALQRATKVAEDEKQPLAQRQAAIGMLAFAPPEDATQRLPQFLLSRTPQPLQRAAVAALMQQASDDVMEPLFASWRNLSPQVRRDVIDGLMSKTSRVERLLAATRTGRLGRADIERDKKQLLMKHPNAKIREQSRELFGKEVDTDRAQVIERYQSALELAGDPDRGRVVFKKQCAVCHRIGEVGHQVAPDLSSVQNKSTSDLLVAILDPNREAQPNFNVYTVTTDQGRVFNGIIASETATNLTLRRAEAKEDVILRSRIDELVSTGVSLMPEGLEKELSPQDLADVISLIKSIKAAARQ